MLTLLCETEYSEMLYSELYIVKWYSELYIYICTDFKCSDGKS
jgi:hypothetical protein